jgi:hypothetical protein
MLKVRAVILEAEGDEATLRAVLEAFVSQSHPTATIATAPSMPSLPRPPATQVPESNGRRGAIAAGSPAHRVLELAKAPVPLRDMVAQAEAIGLKPGQVKTIAAQLVASKHLARTGKSRGTRYVAK